MNQLLDRAGERHPPVQSVKRKAGNTHTYLRTEELLHLSRLIPNLIPHTLSALLPFIRNK